MPAHKFGWIFAGWQLHLMWGNGFGFRLRIHTVKAAAIASERAKYRMTLKFRRDEWDRLCAAAGGDGSSVYNFIKRSGMAAAAREIGRASCRERV